MAYMLYLFIFFKFPDFSFSLHCLLSSAPAAEVWRWDLDMFDKMQVCVH